MSKIAVWRRAQTKYIAKPLLLLARVRTQLEAKQARDEL